MANSNKSAFSYTFTFPYDFAAYSAFVSAIPFKHIPNYKQSIEGKGRNEKACKNLYEYRASGLFLIRPGFNIEIIGNFFYFSFSYI